MMYLYKPLERVLFTQAAVHFGIGLANVINLFHPETIILGGALTHSHELFFQTAVEVAQRNTYRYPEYQPHFSLGTLKEEAVVTGAAIMVRNQMVLSSTTKKLSHNPKHDCWDNLI